MTNLTSMYGITITNPLEGSLEKKLVGLEQDDVVARIVVDKYNDYTPYIDAVAMINQYTTPMLQICDSALDKLLTDDEYNAREQWMVEHLSEYCPIIEIANEIGPNVDWTSGKQVERARRSSDIWIGHERVVTYFWPGAEFERGAFMDWQGENKIECEHRLLSFYPHSMKDFASANDYIQSGRVSGFSECGLENWEGHASHKMKEFVKRTAYTIGKPVCWWTGQSEGF